MANWLESLTARIGLDASGVEVGAKKAVSSIKGIGHDLHSLKNIIVGGFLGNELVSIAREGMEIANRFKDVSDQFGISRQEVQELEHYAHKTGLTVEDVGAALDKMSVLRNEALGGNQDAMNKFSKLGIDYETLQRTEKGIDLFRLAAKTAEDAGNITARGQWREVFGKAGAKLMTFAKEWTEGGDVFRKFADEEIEELHRASLAWEEFFKGIKVGFAQEVAPILEKMTGFVEPLRKTGGKVSYQKPEESNDKVYGRVALASYQTAKDMLKSKKYEGREKELQEIIDQLGNATPNNPVTQKQYAEIQRRIAAIRKGKPYVPPAEKGSPGHEEAAMAEEKKEPKFENVNKDKLNKDLVDAWTAQLIKASPIPDKKKLIESQMEENEKEAKSLDTEGKFAEANQARKKNASLAGELASLETKVKPSSVANSMEAVGGYVGGATRGINPYMLQGQQTVAILRGIAEKLNVALPALVANSSKPATASIVH